MNPQEQKMIDRIFYPELSGPNRDVTYTIKPEKLAKVLVEMEERLPKDSLERAVLEQDASWTNGYLTALDDVENSFEKGTMSILVKVLDNLRKNHKGE